MKKTPILAILNWRMSFVLKAVNTAFFLLCSMYNSAAARENTVFPAFIFEWLDLKSGMEYFLALLYV